jgi:hypothetical protein
VCIDTAELVTGLFEICCDRRAEGILTDFLGVLEGVGSAKIIKLN